MLIEKGLVVSVDEDGLWVETLQQSACDACSAQKGCGQSLVARSLMSNMTLIKARFSFNSDERIWHVGQEVDIGIQENALVFATLIVYLFPLLMLVVGALAGSIFGELGSVIGSLVGFSLGALIVRWHSATRSKQSFYDAVVLD